jgi:AcrR family transcriptional regulator
VRNRAALLLTFYQAPEGAPEELAVATHGTPPGLRSAMVATLQAAEDDLRPGVEVEVFADRMCQSMLHVGIGAYHRTRAATDVPLIKCQMLLHGLAARDVRTADLDRSPAFRAASAAVNGWERREEEALQDGALLDRAAHIHAVARAEFARRGFDGTTIRDIAAAAGVSPSRVYQTAASKDDLLAAIMRSYSLEVADGWQRIAQAPGSPLDKLDALLWFNINVLDRFQEEFRIQAAWLRQNPPQSADLGPTFPRQLRQVAGLLREGARTGDLVAGRAALDVRARCLFALSWTPENLLRSLGPDRSLALARDTLLRGATVPVARRTAG